MRRGEPGIVGSDVGSGCSDDSDGGEDSEDSDTGDDEGSGDDDACGRPRATRVESAVVIELESGKLEAMRAAVELACALMAVDDVLVDAR